MKHWVVAKVNFIIKIQENNTENSNVVQNIEVNEETYAQNNKKQKKVIDEKIIKMAAKKNIVLV